ncbi:MAG: 4Fe-4S dicluster domain-containing protein, partial [Spirochaetia bacterium]|nr:4Fe-4S dicluster domain-containing protein [Spirochaetia bacterium]
MYSQGTKPCCCVLFCILVSENQHRIPDAFRFFNDAMMFETIERQKEAYRRMFADHMAERCIACGECEPQCPQ